MITWLVGENSFEVREALTALTRDFSGTPERVDGASLSLSDLPDLLMGMSLLSMERLVIVTDLSQNTALWEKLPDWLPRVNDAIHLVLVDAKPDKRRAAYKLLKEAATVREYAAWSERDTAKAEQWARARAATMGISLDTKTARALVQQTGPDQWRLANALETLSLVDAVSPEVIQQIIPANPTESVFQLFETALQGKAQRVVDQLATLWLHEDPYAVFALLSSQVVSLAAVATAQKEDAPAKEFGLHPFVASKLQAQARRLSRSTVTAIVAACAQTDAYLKRSKADPELLVERFLIKVASLVA